MVGYEESNTSPHLPGPIHPKQTHSTHHNSGAIRPYFHDVEEIIKQLEENPNAAPQIR